MSIRGRVTFDYSSANGIREIGSGNALFETRWTRAGSDSIHAYRDPPSIDAIAIVIGATEITDVRDAARFDYSSRVRQPKRGEILLMRNVGGLYAALKILGVKSAGHSDSVDEVSFEYVILSDGGRDFSVVEDIPVADATFSKRVLLVGAGFSKNWGGLLAREVREFILGHRAVCDRPALRELVLKEPSFEDALEKARTGLFENEDEAAIEEAIRAAFDLMDDHYRRPNRPVLGATINDFIGRFCPGLVGAGTGYVFSLNQDLLLERVYGTQVNRQLLTMPGVTWLEPPPPTPAGDKEISFATISDMSDGNEPSLLGNFNLIKLHGSINWRSSSDSPSTVMGNRKTLTIANIPLLAWYHRVFERVLSAGDVRLLVIGYGWADEYINEAISEAVKDHRLQVHCWSDSDPTVLLQDRPFGSEILGGLMGVTTRPMIEVMPPTPMSPGSPDYDCIVENFF